MDEQRKRWIDETVLQDRVGLDPQATHVSTGYDQHETDPVGEDDIEAPGAVPLTQERWRRYGPDGYAESLSFVTDEERRYIAEHMVARWKRWGRLP